MVEFYGVTKNIFPLYKGTRTTKFEIAFWSVVYFCEEGGNLGEFWYYRICGGDTGNWFRRNIIGIPLLIFFFLPEFALMLVSLIMQYANDIFWLLYNVLFRHRAQELWLEEQKSKYDGGW